ncbi:hypothetical protein ABZY68_25560 [Streptomyces sp. NPDC006482]|uniref:hypothetical protein n=1 Tax=Streptomyces sp. NPDC006482 TaxID=3154306 RepID=UPI00339F8EB2
MLAGSARAITCTYSRVVRLGCRHGIGLTTSLGKGTPVQHKVLAVTIVIFSSATLALIWGIGLFAVGASPVTAVVSGGGAFAALIAVGMKIVDYLMPATAS